MTIAARTLVPPDADKKAVKLTYFDDCGDVSPKWWVVKNVIARGETSSWYGAPGRGKSTLLTDMGVKVARTTDWRGYRIKESCGVVYFALERGDLVKRRLTAYKRRDNLSGLPPQAMPGLLQRRRSLRAVRRHRWP